MNSLNTFAISIFIFLFCFYTNAQSFSNPEKLFNPTPYAFSHAAKVPANGSFIFISGQSGADENHKYSSDFKTQVKYALEHLFIVLDSYDLEPENVVKITVLIVDHSADKLKIWSEEMHRVWNKKKFPTSTLIPVPRLASDGMLFEVDAVAYSENH